MSDSQESSNLSSDKRSGDAPAPSQTTTISGEGDTSADVVPVPPRYWWLKRIITAGVVLPTVLFGLHTRWGWDVDRRLQKEIDRIVAAGEPIYPEDFDPKEVIRDKDNAVLVYIKAAAALTLAPTDSEFFKKLVGDADAVHANLSKFQAIVEKNQEALDLVRRARSLNRADWNVRMRTPMFSVLLPNLGSQRDLRKFILVTSLLRLEEGDSREAFALLEDAIAQAQTVDTHPTLIGHLLAIAEYDSAWMTIEASLPRLKIASEMGGLAQTAIPRSQITDLIERLRDEDALQGSHILGMQTERASLIDTISAVADGRISPQSIFGGPAVGPRWAMRLFTRAIKPALKTDAHFVLLRLDQTVLAVRQPTWPQAGAMLPPPYPQWSGLDVWLHYLSRMLEPALERAILLHYRSLAMRRMTRIALAIRLYQLDHGERPGALNDLVPDYLPALPIDPFGDGKQVFGYLPDGPWPRLYSVGSNGVDDGGHVAFRGAGKLDLDKFDIPFFLGGSRPKNVEELNAPATQPGRVGYCPPPAHRALRNSRAQSQNPVRKETPGAFAARGPIAPLSQCRTRFGME